MKRWNERVEKRMEEMGLNKNDMTSIDRALESLEAENYDRMFPRNQVSLSEGLWLGGMDRGTITNRDSGEEGLLSFDLKAPPAVIEIDDSEEDSDDDMDVGKGSSTQNTRGTLPPGLGSDVMDMEVGESSSSRPADLEEKRSELLADTPAVANSVGDVEPQLPIRPQIPDQPAIGNNNVDWYSHYRRQQLRESARKFARSKHPAENSGTQKPVNEDEQLGSSGGFFGEALNEVRARTSRIAAEKLIKWTPSVQDHSFANSLFVPSLVELSMRVLTENANSIASLNVVPYFLRKKLIDRLCDLGRMNVDIFNLLLEGCPTELRVKNCSWLTDDQFQLSLQSWQTENLRVLQLNLGGQIMFDFTLKDKLAQSSNSFSKLAVLSLRGAVRLTDLGVELLVKSAPALVSVNLGQCPLLTFEAVESIADYLGKNLRELYIDGCEKIKAVRIASSIMKFEDLEVLSVAGLEDVSDAFILQLVSVCGENLKDLDVADCLELTDSSLKAIASHCPGLLALNISRLSKVTNVGMEFLANGCRSIERLNLTRTKFSDEVIAAFIETSGGSLTELTLNYVRQIGPNTALSLARRSRNLSYLDISWCCRITTNALGLIVDSCLTLKLLKVFGCKQIDSEFLNAHSNPLVRVIGFGLMPILDHLNLLEPEEVFLRYSPLPTSIDS